MAPSRSATRERILAGARSAIARHGVRKLGMQDVSEAAGVSRGTLYRYFPRLDALLLAFTRAEAERFRERVLAEAAAAAPEARLAVMLEVTTRHVQEDPALQRLVESEPGLVLRSVREQYPQLRAQLAELLRPALREAAHLRAHGVPLDAVLDAVTRVLVSTYLYPGGSQAELAETLGALYALLTGSPAKPAPQRSRRPGP